MTEQLREKIQVWADSRFRVPNTFNTQLLIDFSKWLIKEAGYLPPEKVIKVTGIDLEEDFLTVDALVDWATANGYVKRADIIQSHKKRPDLILYDE